MSAEWTIEAESDGQYIQGEYKGADVYISVEVSAIGTPPTFREHVAIEQAPLHLVRAAPLMLEALEGLTALYTLPGETVSDSIDRISDIYERDTGALHPGKDDVLERRPQKDQQDAYKAWVGERIDAARAALAAARGESPTRNEET